MESQPQIRHNTTTAPAAGAGSASGLPFGAMNGPGASARKYTRSCRCTLARRLGGGTSVLAHTNESVSHTGRLMLMDTRSLGLVTESSRPSVMADSDRLRAVSEMLCGARGTQALACGREIAPPSGGPTASRWPVASAMSPDSRTGGSHRRGINDVSTCAGVRRPASF